MASKLFQGKKKKQPVFFFQNAEKKTNLIQNECVCTLQTFPRKKNTVPLHPNNPSPLGPAAHSKVLAYVDGSVGGWLAGGAYYG